MSIMCKVGKQTYKMQYRAGKIINEYKRDLEKMMKARANAKNVAITGIVDVIPSDQQVWHLQLLEKEGDDQIYKEKHTLMGSATARKCGVVAGARIRVALRASPGSLETLEEPPLPTEHDVLPVCEEP
jgi:hypothetical protein